MESQKRQVACIASVSEILNAEYYKQDGWAPNYVVTQTGRNITRVNLMGVVVDVQSEGNFDSITIDDGDTIQAREFGEKTRLQCFQAGDVVLIVGRVREYNQERYIIVEIIRKMQPAWLKYRKKLLNMKRSETTTGNVATPVQTVQKETVVKEPEVASSQEEENPAEKIYNLIKQLDEGQGAAYEEIIEKSRIDNAEEIIKMLLQEGDLFEIRSGVLKILE